jgi:molybdopterin converting factor small subunit
VAVRVRLFASLREAAGVGEVHVPAGPLPEILDELGARWGQPFSARLAVSSVLLDSVPVPRDAPLDVPDGAELALLPPVSGGAPEPAVDAAPLD